MSSRLINLCYKNKEVRIQILDEEYSHNKTNFIEEHRVVDSSSLISNSIQSNPIQPNQMNEYAHGLQVGSTNGTS